MTQNSSLKNFLNPVGTALFLVLMREGEKQFVGFLLTTLTHRTYVAGMYFIQFVRDISVGEPIIIVLGISYLIVLCLLLM